MLSNLDPISVMPGTSGGNVGEGPTWDSVESGPGEVLQEVVYRVVHVVVHIIIAPVSQLLV